jgi:hypothetical protein
VTFDRSAAKSLYGAVDSREERTNFVRGRTEWRRVAKDFECIVAFVVGVAAHIERREPL